MATKNILSKKIQAFENMKNTNHWHHQCNIVPDKPFTYGRPIPIYKLRQSTPILNDISRKLVGY